MLASIMKPRCRLALLVLLAVFMVSQGLAAAGTRAMSFEMGPAADMGDCHGCDDAPGAYCDSACASPLVGAGPGPEPALLPASLRVRPHGVAASPGRITQPEPHPPRASILS